MGRSSEYLLPGLSGNLSWVPGAQEPKGQPTGRTCGGAGAAQLSGNLGWVPGALLAEGKACCGAGLGAGALGCGGPVRPVGPRRSSSWVSVEPSQSGSWDASTGREWREAVPPELAHLPAKRFEWDERGRLFVYEFAPGWSTPSVNSDASFPDADLAFPPGYRPPRPRPNPLNALPPYF